MAGSGLSAPPLYGATNPNLMRPGGKRGEILKERQDFNRALGPLAAITVQEFTNPAAAGAADLRVATATVASATVVQGADLLAAGVAKLLACPRNLTFTTAGTTPANAPASCTIVGTDINNNDQTETVALATTGAAVAGVKAWKTVKSLSFTAAGGTAATVSVGVGTVFALEKPIKMRAGLAFLMFEVAVGVVVTTGTVVAAATAGGNGTYSPATAPNGTNDYAIYYEADATSLNY